MYGSGHPYARETTGTEIAKAKTPPARLAAELREYAETIKLTANMDLFLVGNLDERDIERLGSKHFGDFAAAKGPYLSVPKAQVTRAHHALKGTSQQLKRPLSEVKVAWNTGVTMLDPDVTVLVALANYMDDLVTKELREKTGDGYSPEVTYKPDRCSGIFNVMITSSNNPSAVERRILQTAESLKVGIDADELTHFKDRLEMKRLKTAEQRFHPQLHGRASA